MLIKLKITHDSVMKRHLRTSFESARGNTPVISPLSGVPEITYDAIMYVHPSPPLSKGWRASALVMHPHSSASGSLWPPL